MVEFIRKNITIRKDQDEWLRKTAINLSKFIQLKLDEKMDKMED